jgi:hypothetical protein
LLEAAEAADTSAEAAERVVIEPLLELLVAVVVLKASLQ